MADLFTEDFEEELALLETFAEATCLAVAAVDAALTAAFILDDYLEAVEADLADAEADLEADALADALLLAEALADALADAL